MILKNKYPVTLAMIENHPEKAVKIFKKKEPHEGAFIGVTKLEGSFDCESSGEVFESLAIAEKLVVTPEGDDISMPPLTVSRSDGTYLGKLSYADAILPNMLLSRGVKVWCHAEAKSFNGGLLDIGVSIYCENY